MGWTSSLAKEAVKNSAKTALRVGARAAKASAHYSGRYLAFWGKHPVLGSVVPVVAYRKATGHSLVKDTLNAATGEDVDEKGVVKPVINTVLGKEYVRDEHGNIKMDPKTGQPIEANAGVLQRAVDTLGGRGTYQKAVGVGGVVAGAGAEAVYDVYSGVRTMATDGYQAVRGLGGQAASYFNGNGVRVDTNGQIVDPTSPNYNPEAENRRLSSSAPGFAQSAMGTASNAAQALASGNISAANIGTAMMAWLLFGKFGFLGKIASGALGLATVNNMAHRNEAAETVRQQAAQRQYDEVARTRSEDESSRSVVHMSR